MARKLTRSALIADIQKVAHNGAVTRNFYRENGAYSEPQWQAHFPRFSDFLNAAGLDSKTEPETSEISGDVWNITLPKTRISTLDQLLDYCKVDLSVWEVERFVVNKWEVAGKINDAFSVEPLFQVKATLKKRHEIIAVRREIELLKEDAKRAAPVPKPVIRDTQSSGNMLEINIPDIHVGKLAWPEETGERPYDTLIAPLVVQRALGMLLARTRNYQLDYILFVVGNDLFNSDDLEGRTTKGTQVTTDGRYHKTFAIVRRMITDAIERLRQIAPVKVMMVSGNHDNLSVWHLGDSLECYFHKYADVEIDNQPRQRKYHQYGKVMLMMTHGDKGKRQDYPLLMATEQPEMFGSTKFREAHTGHTHMTKLDEQHGVRVRVLPALCPADDWHAENGFTGNQRVAEAYVWNKDEGLIAQAYYNDDAQPPIVSKRVII